MACALCPVCSVALAEDACPVCGRLVLYGSLQDSGHLTRDAMATRVVYEVNGRRARLESAHIRPQHEDVQMVFRYLEGGT